jgi:hypothetical protein
VYIALLLLENLFQQNCYVHRGVSKLFAGQCCDQQAKKAGQKRDSIEYQLIMKYTLLRNDLALQGAPGVFVLQKAISL